MYQELIERAEDLRATHNAAIRGRRTDLRGASKAHEEALEAALKATIALLAGKGQPVTDATRQAIATTLRGLPGGEPAGRLTRQLQPRGFEMLAGPVAQGRVHAAPPPSAAKVKSSARTDRTRDQTARATATHVATAREAVAAATRSTRDAEQLVRREEFEAARAGRDLEKSERRVKDAEEALRQAETELAESRRAAASAVKAKDAAQARVRKAGEQLADARQREERARADLEELS
ncbi:MAG TPA: hypothetical protein VFP00_06640 [Burkholderiales bacterium]|nr:hypothetical protein [Burkholderiales bacterium]